MVDPSMNEGRNKGYYEDEIELRDYLAVLWRRKWLIAAIVAAVTASAGFWSFVKARSNTRHVTEALIQLNFSGIEKHKNPDGSQFDMHDIIRPEILSSVAGVIEDEEHRKLYSQKSRGYVFVAPFVPEEIKAKIEDMKKERKTYIYLPTEFYLRFIYGLGAPFGAEEAKHVLLAIVRGYEKMFMETYVHQDILPVGLLDNIHETDDYQDIVELLKERINLHVEFLDKRTKEAGLYTAAKNRRSFAELKSILEKIRDVELKALESVIEISHLSKNKNLLVQRYQHKIENIERGRRKKEKEASFARSLLNDLWKKETLAVRQVRQGSTSEPLVVLDSSILQKLSEEDSESFLLKKALEAGIEAEHLEVDRDYFKQKLAMLKERKMTQHNPGDSNGEYVTRQLDMISKSITALARDANDVNREYLERKYSNAVQILKQPESFTRCDVRAGRVVALSFAVGLMLAIFISFFIEYVSKSARKA